MSTTPTTLGRIYLPSNPGTQVGRFEFLVSAKTGTAVEIGTLVAADTAEGTVIGSVVDMRTVGTASDPVAAGLGDNFEQQAITRLDEVVLATVQVFHAPSIRPVRSGLVRAAGTEELALATGRNRMDWAIPAGVLSLADGGFAPVYMDGTALLGPDSAHLMVGGLSGQAAKTSYIGSLLRASIAHSGADHSVAALIFNVKGEDLIWLDQPPAAGYELADEDIAIYEALGVPATPFEDVTVYAPAMPAGGSGTRSARPDALRLAWDLPSVWPYLRYFIPGMYEDEKLNTFLAEFREMLLNHPNPATRVDTFDKLEAWFDERLSAAEEEEVQYAWRSHHKATMWRIRRQLMGLVARGGGLIARTQARPGEDVPTSGWHHGQIVVVDIAGLNPDVQSVVIARTTERLLKSAEEGTLGVDHLVVVADELNSFAPSQGQEMAQVRKILQRVSTQGRYAGISLWGAGQKLSKVDELVRDNAASRALGILSEGEISSGVYGRLPGGLSERLATLPRGFMLLSHYSYRSPLLARFPRPAWRTGKAKTLGASRPGVASVLNLSGRSLERLSEGMSDDMVTEIISGASSAEEARERLEGARVPDMTKTALHAKAEFDPENPFDLS